MKMIKEQYEKAFIYDSYELAIANVIKKDKDPSRMIKRYESLKNKELKEHINNIVNLDIKKSWVIR